MFPSETLGTRAACLEQRAVSITVNPAPGVSSHRDTHGRAEETKLPGLCDGHSPA